MKKAQKDKLPEQGSESPFRRFEQLAKKVVGVRKDVLKKYSKMTR